METILRVHLTSLGSAVCLRLVGNVEAALRTEATQCVESATSVAGTRFHNNVNTQADEGRKDDE